MSSKLKVSRLQSGTVIDHLSAGSALKLLDLLSPSADETILAAFNVESKKMGKKDILKIEGRSLTPSEFDKVAIISPGATVNLIRNGEIIEKGIVEFPNYVVGILICANNLCITNHEDIKTKFTWEAPFFRCRYCERAYPLPRLELK